MTDSTIVKTLFLKAPPATVWSFLTEKDKLGTWFYAARADLAPGTDYELVAIGRDGKPFTQVWGTVQVMEPPTRLVYSFTIPMFDGVLTTVSWQLEAQHGGTKLTLTHAGLDGVGDAPIGLLADFDAGWDRHFGTFRKALAETATVCKTPEPA